MKFSLFVLQLYNSTGIGCWGKISWGKVSARDPQFDPHWHPYWSHLVLKSLSTLLVDFEEARVKLHEEIYFNKIRVKKGCCGKTRINWMDLIIGTIRLNVQRKIYSTRTKAFTPNQIKEIKPYRKDKLFI